MKKQLMSLVLACSIIMLINSVYAQTHKKPGARVAPKKGPVSEITEGKNLIAKSDCLTCHKLDVKLIGPAYKDVAAKYPANNENYNLLAKKIITGGSGTWGEVPMSPHPTISETDAKKMAKYILTVK